MQLTQASRQWANRPNDERFTSLHDLFDRVSRQRSLSRAPIVSTRDIVVRPDPEDKASGLQVVRLRKPGEGPVHPYSPTNWAFNQLSKLASAPSAYLKSLPAPMAADCINYGIHHAREVENVGLLLTKDGDVQELRAACGPNYGRIWNEEVVRTLIDMHGDGVTGRFRVPGEFGKAVKVTRANTTIFGSDRDIFVFLADETNRVEVKNRRNGQPGSLARGFFTWNSEVGNSSIGVAFFFFDHACQNRIVWGAENFREIRINHTASAPWRWLEEITPMLTDYADAAAAPMEQMIRRAQAKKADDNLDRFLASRFTTGMVATIKATHEREEGRPIETLWDAVTAVTAQARSIEHQDSRVAMERIGGKILDLVAA